MSETRKIAAILVSDVVGYSRLAGADEERTLARLRALRSDLFDPSIALHHGRVVKRTGDGIIVELGEKALRNIAHPVRVFAFDAAAASASRGSVIPSSRRMPDEEKIAAPEK